MGNGSTQCVLYGDEFGLLGASSTFCDDCRKVSSGVGSGGWSSGAYYITSKTQGAKLYGLSYPTFSCCRFGNFRVIFISRFLYF